MQHQAKKPRLHLYNLNSRQMSIKHHIQIKIGHEETYQWHNKSKVNIKSAWCYDIISNYGEFLQWIDSLIVNSILIISKF